MLWHLEVIKLLKEKLEIIEHHHKFINFVSSLKIQNEILLRQPLKEGKWSIIEIIHHFFAWDQFVLQSRLPYLLSDNVLPISPQADDFNNHSSELARRRSSIWIIEKCIHTRTELMNTLKALPEEDWLMEFRINKSTITLYDYLTGLMEHDLHHMSQINVFFNDNYVT